MKDTAASWGILLLLVTACSFPLLVVWGLWETAQALSWRQIIGILFATYACTFLLDRISSVAQSMRTLTTQLESSTRTLDRRIAELEDRIRHLPTQTSRAVYDDLSQDIAHIQRHVEAIKAVTVPTPKGPPQHLIGTDGKELSR